MSRRRGILQALASAALFGAATPVSKRLLESVPSVQLAGLFYLGAAVGLAPVLLRRWPGASGFRLPRDRRSRRFLAGAVVFGGLLGPVLLLLGLRLAKAASVAMLLNLETVATAVLAAWFFREHLGRWAWTANIGILSAGVLLAWEGGSPGILGGLLVASAAVCWGLDNNFTALIDGITPAQSTFWKGLAAGSVNLALGAAVAPVAVGVPWLAALAVGALSYGLSITLYVQAAQGLGATRSQMIFATSPFFGVLLATGWLGESMAPLQWAALLLLVGALVLLFREQHDHRHVHEPVEHTHSHRHDDGHHDHQHPGLPRSTRHTHRHAHGRVVHRHPHWPDLHHRHPHPAAPGEAEGEGGRGRGNA